MEVTRTLARYVVDAKYDDLPAEVVAEAKRTILNWLGVAIGGCRHEAVEVALATVTEFTGKAEATVLGRGERLDLMHAALVNGISSHVFDFDDTHLKTVIHPAGPVVSAVLAMAERMKFSGTELIHATVLGIEVECRIGNAVYPSHYDVGWHITATTGVFGAAAAVGKLLGLNEEQMTYALGIAATQAAGLREMFGTHCKPLHPGRAAQNGMLAAFLAKKGFTSSTQGIEGRRGFANVLATGRNYAEITEGLGQSFEILLNSYKPFACGIVIHPTIDGCIQLRNEHALTAEMIERIDLTVHPLVLELTGKLAPRTGLEGKFSVFHSAAIAMIDGAGREAQYSDEKVVHPRTVELRGKVHAVVDHSIHEDEVKIQVALKDGRLLHKHVEHAIGSIERPMTNQDLEEKFRELCAPILSTGQIDNLLVLCSKLESLPDASILASSTVPR